VARLAEYSFAGVRRPCPSIPQNQPLPTSFLPPSFSLLVATFASQATVAFGHVPHPIDGKTEVRLGLAKHAIDMLTVVEQKTKGNLAPDEAAMLDSVLHQLRLAYVEASARK
jgi:hypothetical protein